MLERNGSNINSTRVMTEACYDTHSMTQRMARVLRDTAIYIKCLYAYFAIGACTKEIGHTRHQDD